MAFNLWWLFFSMAAGISLFGGLLLMIGSARQGAGTRALGFLLLVFSITLVDYVMFWSDNVAHFPHLSGLWQAGNYLYGPLLLAFYNKDISLAWKKWLPHFIPGLLLLFTWLPFGILPTAEKLAWMQTKYVFDTPLLLHRSLLYLLTPVPMVGTQFLYGLYFLWQSQAMENGERKWKRGIAVLFLVFVLAQLIYFVLIRLPGFKAEWDYMCSVYSALRCSPFIGPNIFSTEKSGARSKVSTTALHSPVVKVHLLPCKSKAMLNNINPTYSPICVCRN
jgi:hypothetical protein